MSFRGRAWRAWYRARWLAWDRRQMARERRRRVAGIDVVVLPGVLDPSVFFSSEVLVGAVRLAVTPGEDVLDLGTGTGIAAIAAAEAGAARVIAVDVDPIAVDCARRNVDSRGLGARIEVRAGDLFEPVAGERFDLVAFNPPYLRLGKADRARAASAGLGRALDAPTDLAARFAVALPGHLTLDGAAMIVLSTAGDPEAWLAPLRANGFEVTPTIERARGAERLTAYRCRLHDSRPI
ncbi:MAG: 50S ribosomal protein L11 methyltransferase [Candidatus Limnocylindrales bacterium]